MNTFTRFSALLLLMVTVVSCDSLFGPSDEEDSVLFRSSFETKESIEIWSGYGISRSDESCPGGGKHSAYVSGGCSAPHAYLYLPPSKKDRYLSFSFWAKRLVSDGFVTLSVIDTKYGATFQVSDTTWTHYQTDINILCFANHIPRFSMSSGGLVQGGMLVDLIVVEEVDRFSAVPLPKTDPP